MTDVSAPPETAPTAPVDPSFAERVQQAASAAASTAQTTADQTAAQDTPLQTYVTDPLQAAVGGAWQSLFETKDFFTGDTPEEDKSWFRKMVEEDTAAVDRKNAVNAFITGATQLGVGLVGAGKIGKGAMAAKAALGIGGELLAGSRAAKVAVEAGKAAAVGAVVFDPHQARLSNLLQQFPILDNPVTNYLAAKPTDTDAEGRFKNVLESIGLDAAALGLFAIGVKGVRALRSGDARAAADAQAEAVKTIEKTRADTILKDAQTQANDATGQKLPTDVQPGTTTAPPPVASSEVAPPAAEKPRIRVQAGDATGATAKPVKTMGDVVTQMEESAKAKAEAPPVVTPSQPEAIQGGLKEADAVKTPAKPIAQFPEEDLAKIMVPVSKDLQALEAYGSRQGAAEAGHVFGGADRLPWQMLRTPEDVQAFMGRVADYFENTITKRKGGAVLTDKRLQSLVNQRVFLFGEKPADILGLIQSAGKQSVSMAANMEAATSLGMKMMDEAMLVHNKLRVGNLDQWGGDAAAGMNEFAHRTGLAIEMLANAKSMLSNSGRALRRGRGDLPRLGLDQLRKLKDLPPEALSQMFNEANGDIGTVARMLQKPDLLGKAIGVANFLRVNNLLWGWKTQVVNAATNLYMLSSRPFERVLGASIGQITGAFDGATASSLRVQAVREYRYMASSLLDSFMFAKNAFLSGDSILAPHQTEYFRSVGQAGTNAGALPFKAVQNVGDLVYNTVVSAERILGLPVRSLGAADEFVKQITYRSSVLADASMEADAMGLKGPAYKAHLNARLDDAFDARGAATNPTALQEAKVRTFSQDLVKGEGLVTDLGRAAQNAKAAHPALGLILPFVRTPTNVLKYALNLTPGLNVLQKGYRAALTGAQGDVAQAHAVGQMTLGALFLGAAATLVEAGMFTGSGPSDPKKRSALMNTGWQPNSVVTANEDGTRTYTPLNRFDPVAMPFGVLADLMDVAHSAGTPEAEGVSDAASGLLLAVANQVKNRTYLLGLSQFLDAVMSPDQRASKFVGSIAGSLVPMSSFWRMTSSDPYLREVRGITDALMANTPGLSQNLPARYDAWGDPIENRSNRFSSDTAAGVVDNEMIRMGLDKGYTVLPPTPYDAGAGDMRDITLEDGRNAYEAYQQLAGHPKGFPALKDQIAKLIQSPSYQKAIDGDGGTKGTRQWMIREVTGKYRQAARNQLRASSQVFREKSQEAELKARSALASGQRPAKQSGDLAAIHSLAKSYGFDLSGVLPDKLPASE